MEEKTSFLPNGYNIENISEEKAREAATLIRTISLLLQVTEKPIYLVDLKEDKIIYTSAGLNLVCGINQEEVLTMSHDFFTKYVPEHELEQIDRFRDDAYKSLLDRAKTTKCWYKANFNFHLCIANKKRLFLCTIVPLLFSDDGLPWLTMCVLSQSYSKSTRYASMRWQGERISHLYDMKTHIWEEKEEIKLTDTEKDVLHLSAQGYTAKEIADNICKSLESVKLYKHQLFKKLHVSNMPNALMCSLSQNLL